MQNNPANYTDPSGHYGSPFAMMEGGRGRPVRGYSQPKPLMNPTDGTLYAPSTPEHRAHQVRQQQTQIYSYNYTPSPNAPRTSYQQTLWQQTQAQRSISNAWEQAKAIGQSVYDWGASRTREAANIARNWTKSLEETITHVCTTAERWVEAGVNFLRNVNWKNILKTAAGVAEEFFYVNDLYRVVTGTDPVSGEEANRLEATAWLAVDIISAGSSKLGKVATVATKADDLFDIVRSSKFVTQANKTLDGAKTFVKSNVDKPLDTSFQLGPKLAPAGGSSVGGTTLREVGQNVKKSLDNLVNYFKKNGDEVGKRTGKSPNVSKNRQQGKLYEEQEFSKFKQEQPDGVREITIKTNSPDSSGTRIRLDGIGRSSDGKLKIVEYKSSPTAPLTKNQKKGFPELEEFGGTVVGKGKEPFIGGTVIEPGTKVEVIRPN